ncbi:hypothetical protein E2C01_030981 [Portunus trituberculatus]|uniref:Uncharacterized protein n=1 Tax=Portunus trituberculatus TaxID=210409 RepID=A0A5B7ESF8_PORTR|nr:hypothetical protein [Portunus trituberculatus]
MGVECRRQLRLQRPLPESSDLKYCGEFNLPHLPHSFHLSKTILVENLRVLRQPDGFKPGIHSVRKGVRGLRSGEGGHVRGGGANRQKSPTIPPAGRNQ